MGDALGWLWIAIVLIGSLAVSAVTRRGRSERARKVFLDLYRRPYLPAIVRNVWVVMPVLVAALVTMWIGISVVPRLAESGILQDSIAFPLAFGAIGLAVSLFGGFVTLASQPPRRLVPPWLPEDNRVAAYKPPKLDLFDRIVLAIGVLFGIAGVLVLVAVSLGFAHR